MDCYFNICCVIMCMHAQFQGSELQLLICKYLNISIIIELMVQTRTAF